MRHYHRIKTTDDPYPDVGIGFGSVILHHVDMPVGTELDIIYKKKINMFDPRNVEFIGILEEMVDLLERGEVSVGFVKLVIDNAYNKWRDEHADEVNLNFNSGQPDDWENQ